MEQKKKVLITGASGTVGKEALEILVKKRQYTITVFDLKTKRAESIFNPYKNQINIIYGDLTNPEDVSKAVKNTDAVIHLGAVIPPLADTDTRLAYNVNVNGTKNLLNALEGNAPNAFFMYASSISVYGDRVKSPMIRTSDPLIASERDYYAETKIEAESLIQKSELQWTIFRLSAVMGYGNHKMSGIMFEMPLETSIEIISPKDTAMAFVNGLEKKEKLISGIFNLGGGERNRIHYRDFMERSFQTNGLGKVNFPQYAFAEKNYHCGFYADGDILNDILCFRNDTLESYFENLKKSSGVMQRFLASVFKVIVKKRLLALSHPYQAYKNNDKKESARFFETTLAGERATAS